MCFLEQRLDHFDNVRNAIMILMALSTSFHDALQEQLISRKTWNRPIHEVFHVKAVCVWMARALLQNPV